MLLALHCRADSLLSIVIAEIEEPCAHSVQFGGMCVNCGKDMTESVPHNSIKYRSRLHGRDADVDSSDPLTTPSSLTLLAQP